jgi:DNA invertase Pin-like site-specific DNA recombinase
MVAEMELSFTKDRQRAGIEAAKANGVYRGRPVTFGHERILVMRREGRGPREIARGSGARERWSTRSSTKLVQALARPLMGLG